VTFDLMRTVRANFWSEKNRNFDSRGHWGLGGHIVPDFFRSGDYTLVKSTEIIIQGRYALGGGYALHGLAFGGPFLQNHKLVVYDLWSGAARFKWDGQPISVVGGYAVKGLVNISSVQFFTTWGLASATIQLPSGVSVSLFRSVWNNGRGASVQATISMPKQPDGQDGHCGKADGDLADDTQDYMLANWGSEVSSSERIFDEAMPSLLGEDSKAESAYDPAQVCANSPPYSEDVRRCEEALNGTAEALRDALLPGCIIDVCVGGPDAVAAAAEAAKQSTAQIVAAGDPLAPKTPDGWYDGGGQKSCDEGCAAVGLVCTEAQLRAHNEDVSDPQKVRDMIEQLGGKTLARTCDQTWGDANDVPNFWLGGCHASLVPRAASTFSCSARPRGTRLPKHRLCYCHSPA